MTDKTPPYVIDASAARVDDLLELSGFPSDPELRVAGRAHDVGGVLSVGVYSVTFAIKIRLLDRPEPPKPAPPSEVGSVVLVEDVAYYWGDPEQAWLSTDPDHLDLTPQAMASKAWTLAKIVPADDPTAPKADDGLRERVESLAEYYKLGGVYALPPAEVYAHLRSILLTDGADQ